MINLSDCREQEAYEKELEKFSIRRAPLGMDRHYRQYWYGLAGQRSVIYVEREKGEWTVISQVEDLDRLITALEKRGVRELALHAALEKVPILSSNFYLDKLADIL